jgi:hypothetical protein
MTKYRICKFVNGNGEEWYQVKKRVLLFWYWAFAYEYFGAGGMIRNTHKFFTIEQAQKYIEDDIRYIRRGQVKKAECFDYE